ncbi:hypothetical protein ACFSTH_16585 [Paenibacillus yanchengensis]|uniref:NHL repeat containing protein n=1 Tax=Paenibacillus yanchengensis TaxID=2035833 RepID=A0ABW4YPV2_9BACL
MGKSNGASGQLIGEFNAPTHLAVDKDGNVFVSEQSNQRTCVNGSKERRGSG